MYPTKMAKYLGIKVTREEEDLYTENYKTLLKVKTDRHFVFDYLRQSTDFSAIPTKIPITFFIEIEQKS